MIKTKTDLKTDHFSVSKNSQYNFVTIE